MKALYVRMLCAFESVYCYDTSVGGNTLNVWHLVAVYTCVWLRVYVVTTLFVLHLVDVSGCEGL